MPALNFGHFLSIALIVAAALMSESADAADSLFTCVPVGAMLAGAIWLWTAADERESER